MQEGDQFYAHCVFPTRPPESPNFQTPRLHMRRCKTYPQCIANMLNTQAFELMRIWLSTIVVLKTRCAGLQCQCAAQCPPLDGEGG